MSALRPKADAQSARVRIELMSAFPKADIQNVRIGPGLYGCLWPNADIETESKWVSVNVRFGEKSGHSGGVCCEPAEGQLSIRVRFLGSS